MALVGEPRVVDLSRRSPVGPEETPRRSGPVDRRPPFDPPGAVDPFADLDDDLDVDGDDAWGDDLGGGGDDGDARAPLGGRPVAGSLFVRPRDEDVIDLRDPAPVPPPPPVPTSARDPHRPGAPADTDTDTDTDDAAEAAREVGRR